ncbi:MAG: hypothetical protein J5742_00165 [Alphaproteobacteria bacterium]|nr:hypothetical protein [Alphaproteobacteria bacterium]
MAKQRIGYDEYQEKLELQRRADELKQKKEEQEKKKKEAEKEKLRVAKAQEKLEKKKERIVASGIQPLRYSFLKGALIGQMVAFGLGNLMFGVDHVFNEDNGQYYPPRYHTYGEAIRNAYGAGDWKEDPYNVAIDTFLNLLITSIVMSIVVSENAKRTKKEAKQLLGKIEGVQYRSTSIWDLEQKLADLNVDGNKILESLSEVDRSYFEKLAKGNWNEAGYEKCIAIIRGYLKSHKKEYEEIIKVIDEAVLPEDIKKKYGKGKVISFGAAQALSELKR